MCNKECTNSEKKSRTLTFITMLYLVIHTIIIDLQVCLVQQIIQHIPCILQLDQLVDISDKTITQVTTGDNVYISGVLVCVSNKFKSKIFHKELSVGLAVPVQLDNNRLYFETPEFSSSGTLDIYCTCNHKNLNSQTISIAYYTAHESAKNSISNTISDPVEQFDVVLNDLSSGVVAQDSNGRTPLSQVLASGCIEKFKCIADQVNPHFLLHLLKLKDHFNETPVAYACHYIEKNKAQDWLRQINQIISEVCDRAVESEDEVIICLFLNICVIYFFFVLQFNRC